MRFHHPCCFPALALAALCLPAAAAAQALSRQQMDIAAQVHTGLMPCGQGAFVSVRADTARPGHFFVDGAGFRYHMAPVATSTGAVRLEDAQAGAMWLQIADQSMLMNQKQGRRMADACVSRAQALVREQLLHHPRAGALEMPARPEKPAAAR